MSNNTMNRLLLSLFSLFIFTLSVTGCESQTEPPTVASHTTTAATTTAPVTGGSPVKTLSNGCPQFSNGPGGCPCENGNCPDPFDGDPMFFQPAGGGGGNYNMGPNVTVGIHAGTPGDGTSCNGSLAVGDNVGSVNGKPASITDINTVAQANGMPKNMNGYLGIDTTVVGWVYSTSVGYFVQMNSAAFPSFSVTVTLWFASFGLTSPSQSSPIYVGTTAPNTCGKNGLRNQQCYTGGKWFG